MFSNFLILLKKLCGILGKWPNRLIANRSNNDTHHWSQKGVRPTSNRHTRPSSSLFSFYGQVSPGVNGCKAFMGENSILHWKWEISDILGHLLCSKMAIPVWQMDSFTPLFSFRCKWIAESWPEELTFLCCTIRLWRGCFVPPVVQICAVLAALNRENYITVLMSGCFVLGMDKFLPQCVGKLGSFTWPGWPRTIISS